MRGVDPAVRSRRTNPDARMTVTDHLRELRRRLVVVLLAIAAGAVVGWFGYGPVLHLLEQPYCGVDAAYRFTGPDGRCVLVYHGVLDGFMTHVKLAVIIGAVLSAPVWLLQLWRYVTPGLHRNERRYTVTFVLTSSALFAAGTTVAYLVLGKAMSMLLHQGGGTVQAMLTIDGYLSFIAMMLFVFGLSFELPVVVVLANRAGVLPARTLARTQRIAVFLIVVFAGVAVPSTDPFSMLAMAVPMVALYEAAVGIATIHDRRAARRASEPSSTLPTEEPAPA